MKNDKVMTHTLGRVTNPLRPIRIVGEEQSYNQTRSQLPKILPITRPGDVPEFVPLKNQDMTLEFIQEFDVDLCQLLWKKLIHLVRYPLALIALTDNRLQVTLMYIREQD